ncbi:MAG: ATP-binding cassette domain-containing protein [Alphaproteobacteria bacterium]|nr:ATP-binding cassette domain-containing protein [Alphaproteobacteria bacterium]
MLRMFKTYVRPRLKTIAFAMVLMMISAAMTGIMAKLMEPVIDKVFADKDAAMLWPVALGVLAVFTLRGAANYGQNVLMNMLGQRIVSDMQQDLFAHLVYADLAFLQKEYSGQLISRFLSDINTIRMAAVQSLTGIGKNLFTVVFLIIVMFMQDWKLAASSLFVFPAAAWSVSLLGKKLRKVSASTQVSMGDFSSALGQAFQGARHIKSYGMEEHEKLRVFSYINRVCKLMNRSYRFSAIATPVGEVLSGVAIVTIIVYGGHEVITGGSTAGKLFSFITAFLLAFEPMKRLAQLNNSMQMGLAGMERLFSLLDMKPEITDKPGAKDLALKDSTVRFDDVVFAYPDGTLALNGLSFTAPTGKTVALVGESGAGKSTILNLIPRFYDVSEGAVLVDGQDVRDVTMRSLRANMALVSQEVAIFTDTLRENIAYGRPDATEEEIIAAAKLAAAHDFIMEQPQGYDTRVGEQGVKLSGGQRQRISIARAMLRNAPILLLDEATSALDANSERLVQSAIDRLQKGRTTIVVAHRLSTIMDADIIYVMSQGRVVESGSHDALLKSGGAYARLYGTLMRETA